MAPRVFTDRYQIVRHIARGGMAEVYLAQDLMLDRPVALKVLFPEFAADRSFVERFRREARSAARLNHPNIVSIYDTGEENGTYYIVMEYVEGRTLREIIRTEGPLHPNRAAEIGSEIAAGLAFAHRGGRPRGHDAASGAASGADRGANDAMGDFQPIIHRDVKPGNVIISNTVKVTDFGIARAGDPAESLTQTGAVMGTATYFSPEQAQGQGIDPRSDVYSLGVVLYEMVTGRPPFTGDSPVAIAYQHVREQPVPPSRHNPDVPPAFDAIVMKALAKNKANRYRSAEALRDDLLRFANGQAVSAEPLMAPPVAATRAQRVVMVDDDTPVADGTRVMARTRAGVVDEDEWEPVEEPRGARTGIYIIILVVLLAILGGMLFLLARELGVGGSEQAVVPGVIGDPQAEAVTKVEDAGLQPLIETRPDDLNKPGQVLDQDPKPGTRLDKGSTVKLIVAGAAEQVDVPDVRTRALDDARRILEDRGFLVRTTFQTSDRVPANEVIDQNPRPGKASKGSTVNLVVSSGVDEVTVPSLFGSVEADAAKALTDRGFRVERREEADSQVPDGHVIRTVPGAGTPLARGAAVTLVVSSGPPPTVAPTTPTTVTTLPSTTTSRPSGTTTTSRPTTTTTAP